MVRKFGWIMTAAMFLAVIMPTAASATTSTSSGSIDTQRVVPNVYLYLGRNVDSAGHVSYTRMYSAYDAASDSFLACSDCGKIVTITRQYKQYFVLRMTEGQQLLSAHWTYTAPDGVGSNGPWDGTRILKHEVETIRGMTEHMTITTLNVDIYDPSRDEPAPCGPSCGK